jgi:hypothetical protein
MAMQSDGVRQTYGRLTSPVPNLSKGEKWKQLLITAKELNGFLITTPYSTSLSKIFMVDGFGRMFLKQHFGDREKIWKLKIQ